MVDYIVNKVNIDISIAVYAHAIYTLFLFYKLRNEESFFSLLFISQIPLLMFPFYRFSWGVYNHSIIVFLILNYSILLLFYFLNTKKINLSQNTILKSYIVNNNNNKIIENEFANRSYKLRTLELLSILFIFSTSFSMVNGLNFHNSFFAGFYVICWYLSFYLAIQAFAYNEKFVFLSLYYFLLSSLVFIGFIIYSYLRKYGIPFSVKEIYVNKLEMTFPGEKQLTITGNIHNVVPFVFFINILSCSLISFFLKNKKARYKINQIINLKLPSFNTIIYLNLLLSLFFFFLFLTRGAIILLAISYVIFHFIFFWEKKYKNILIYLILLCIVYRFSEARITEYFHNSFNSLYNIFTSFFIVNNQQLPLSDVSVDERLDAFRYGIQIIKDNILFGIGVDNYWAFEKIYTSPHNIIVHYIAETGVLGILFIIGILTSLAKNLIRKKLDFLFCIVYSTTAFFLYMTLIGGQFFVSGMCINGLTFFYALFVMYSLKDNLIDNTDKNDFSEQLNNSE